MDRVLSSLLCLFICHWWHVSKDQILNETRELMHLTAAFQHFLIVLRGKVQMKVTHLTHFTLRHLHHHHITYLYSKNTIWCMVDLALKEKKEKKDIYSEAILSDKCDSLKAKVINVAIKYLMKLVVNFEN